ncbi:hypothetical protein K1W54_09375 [Micromonospora sp. CPCC 205371]|nr:hypothetical protein [Micromonospora sp. CPCC 205371]
MTSLREHADHSGRYVVIHRPGQGVLGMGTAEELRDAVESGAPPPPAVLVPADWTFAQLVESDVITLLDLTTAGVVLMDGGRPAGVVPLDRIRRYLIDEGSAVRTRVQGDGDAAADAVLPGDYQTGRARVACAAPGCGYVNTLAFFDRNRPPTCANTALPTHPLSIRR